MKTLLTEAQLEFKNYIAEYLEKELKPYVKEIEGAHSFPMGFYKKLAKDRLLALNFPKHFGGQEYDCLRCAILIEEMAKLSSGVAGTVTTAGMTGPFLILDLGNEEQKETYLHGVATGETITAFGATEPNAGSDLTNIETIAIKEGGNYRINGSKTFCTNASVANIFIIITNTNPEGPRKEFTAFLLEKDTAGMKVGEKFDKMGWTCQDTAEVYLNDVVVPESSIIGSVGKGFNAAFSSINFTRIILAATAYGVCQAALQLAIEHSRNVKIGERPLIDQQGIRCEISDLATEIEAAGLLIYRAATLQDRKQNNRKEAAMAKYYATNLAKKVTKETMRMLGPEGYYKNGLAATFFLDSPVFTIADGTSEIQKENIAKGLKLAKPGQLGK